MRLLVICALVGCGGSDGGDPVPSDSDVSSDSSSPAIRSAGCGVASTATPEAFSQRTIDGRDLWVRVPTDYDPERAYPVIYEMHGCSSAATREDNNVPVENHVGDAAIVVRARAAANCWDTSTTGPDVPYVDAVMDDVENAFCVDTSRRFMTGYSSGSFMTHVLGCIRGDKLRGIASIAGGQAGNDCTGDPAALLIHDENDNTVNISASLGARDNHLTRNACGATTTAGEDPCVVYDGCAAGKPVVWCQTSMQDHSRQDQLAGPIFWSFIDGLR